MSFLDLFPADGPQFADPIDATTYTDFTPSSAGSHFWDSLPMGESSFADGGAVLPPVLNLPRSGNTGISGIFKDLTNLVSNVYAGETQVANAQAGLRLQQAQNALALRNVTQAPSMWAILGLGGAALLAIVLVEKTHK